MQKPDILHALDISCGIARIKIPHGISYMRMQDQSFYEAQDGQPFQEDFAAVARNEKYFHIDTQFERLYGHTYYWATNFNGGIAFAMISSDVQYHCINTEGRILFDNLLLDQFWPFTKHHIALAKDIKGNYHFILATHAELYTPQETLELLEHIENGHEAFYNYVFSRLLSKKKSELVLSNPEKYAPLLYDFFVEYETPPKEKIN